MFTANAVGYPSIDKPQLPKYLNEPIADILEYDNIWFDNLEVFR